MADDSRLLKARARNHRRRFVRRLGCRAGDLDVIAAMHLEAWAQLRARLDGLDDEGRVDDPVYVTTSNSATRALRLLELRLRELDLVATAKRQPGAALEAWAASRNGAES